MFKIIKNINFSHGDCKFKMVKVNRFGTPWTMVLGSRYLQMKTLLIWKIDCREFSTVSGMRVMQAASTQVLSPKNFMLRIKTLFSMSHLASPKITQER